jgi:hypothetical protein
MQRIKFILNKGSLYKFNSDNTAISAINAATEIFTESVKSNMPIKKIVIRGRGARQDCNYGGVDIVVIKNKKWLLSQNKKAIETMDNGSNPTLANVKHLFYTALGKLDIQIP